jgi:hypothetical protein
VINAEHRPISSQLLNQSAIKQTLCGAYLLLNRAGAAVSERKEEKIEGVERCPKSRSCDEETRLQFY